MFMLPFIGGGGATTTFRGVATYSLGVGLCELPPCRGVLGVDVGDPLLESEGFDELLPCPRVPSAGGNINRLLCPCCPCIEDVPVPPPELKSRSPIPECNDELGSSFLDPPGEVELPSPPEDRAELLL